MCFIVFLTIILSFVISNLIAMWEVLTGDLSLLRTVLNHLMEVLVLTLPYHEKNSTSVSGAITTKRVETPIPKSVRAVQLQCTILNIIHHLRPVGQYPNTCI